MKLPRYKDILKMGKEKVDETMAPIRAMRARKQAELEMAKLDEQIASKEAAIHEACTQKEVNFEKVIELQNDLALTERKKKQYQKILDEMFGE